MSHISVFDSITSVISIVLRKQLQCYRNVQRWVLVQLSIGMVFKTLQIESGTISKVVALGGRIRLQCRERTPRKSWVYCVAVEEQW